MHDYDYVISKPELGEDLLMHYGIKGMKWKNHLRKFVDSAQSGYNSARNRVLDMLPILRKNLRSTGRKTKSMYYRGKSKMAELNAANARRHTGVKDTDITQRTKTIRTGYYNKWEAHGIRPGTSGKANSHSGQAGLRNVKTTKVNIKKKKK